MESRGDRAMTDFSIGSAQRRSTKRAGWAGRGRKVVTLGSLACLLVLGPLQAHAAQPLSNPYCSSPGAGSSDTCYGNEVLAFENGGNFNVAFGDYALSNNTTGLYNTGIGEQALRSNGTGCCNVASGSYAMSGAQCQACNGQYDTATGYEALFHIDTGSNDTADGINALILNTSGNENTADGANALYNNQTGSDNAADGFGALGGNYCHTCSGSNNTAAGKDALYNIDTGSNDTALGYDAGGIPNGSTATTSGSNDTFLGSLAGPGTSTQLSNATAIGANAVVDESNALVLGGTGSNAVNVGIGTATPDQALTVAGNVHISGSGNGIIFPDGTVQTSAASGGGLPSPGSSGNVLQSDGASWISAPLTAGEIPNLSSQYVDLTTNQVIAGTKTFSSTIQGDISGNAGTVTNGVYTSGAYADPSWLTSLSGSKISGTIPVSSIPAGSSSYIQNGTAQQASANFNISGNGTLGGSLSAATAGIGISGTPNSLLQVGTSSGSFGSYLQLPLVTNNAVSPPPADCNSSTLVGRVVLQATTGPKPKLTLWACTTSGKWTAVK